MLILFRDVGETIVIDDDIRLTVREVSDDKAVIEVDAPSGLEISKEEQSRFVSKQDESGK